MPAGIGDRRWESTARTCVHPRTICCSKRVRKPACTSGPIPSGPCAWVGVAAGSGEAGSLGRRTHETQIRRLLALLRRGTDTGARSPGTPG
jgi:hypothetical protein